MPAQTRSSDAQTADDLATVLLEIYAINNAINQHLLAHLDPRAWRAQPPGLRGSGRTIAAIFAHLHNARLVWIRNSAPHLTSPARLDPERCTIKQAATAHAKSAKQCSLMLADALTGGPKRRVTKFHRGSWTRLWPAGGTMFAYMFAHEAHHRGQILMLAHQMGFRFPEKSEAFSIWQWDRFWRESGLKTRPR
jgi:uncharacterized damage-inducible protein DinB